MTLRRTGARMRAPVNPGVSRTPPPDHRGDSMLLQTSTKKASPKRASARGCAVRWPDVLRALPADDARSYAVSRYRSAGFTPDTFGTRAAP